MQDRKPPIIRVDNKRIIIETYEGTQMGSIIAQLERLLGPYGYIKVSQNELIYLHQDASLRDGVISFGADEHLKSKIPRRMQKSILSQIAKIVERKTSNKPDMVPDLVDNNET
jgi:hypothetical protein